ncbi:hypothetical protein QBC36DRAFT_356657 [Triangularia setosa]|uniref:Uncharacterized protein n=1 Tax=Triangularia setosa TaxID=2587417 RepID=A0AAN7A641_9PEZI|nr:hypothetical protein QBC36DRAFT_356657 [Podospora setosa]
MALSKTVSIEEYLERNKENLCGEDVPRPIAQPSASYLMPLRTLFDANDDEMTDEERRFFNRRYQTFVDNASSYIENDCQSQADINQFVIRRLARQDAAIDRLERRFTRSIAAAVEAEIDIFLGHKPTSERIRGINRRLNTMQLELKTLKDEAKSHPEFGGSSEDVWAKKAAMAAATGVANKSKKRKKAAGTAVPVGEGAGQGPDRINFLYESMLNMASQLRNLHSQPPTPAASDEDQPHKVCDARNCQAAMRDVEQTKKEYDPKMRLGGAADDAEMTDNEASLWPEASPNGQATTPATNLTNQPPNAGFRNGAAVTLPVRTVGSYGYPADAVE